MSQIEKGVEPEYLYFWGHTPRKGELVGNFIFSQWYERPFEVEGVVYPSAEHWMMAHKAGLFENHDIFEQIIRAQKPAEVKELGRQVRGFDDAVWRAHRYNIVVQGNIHKFGQHRDLRDYLVQTGDKVLVEASPVDTVWGIGLAQDAPEAAHPLQWKGINLLGFALMEARDFLNASGHD